jgi:hypothetical protein
VSPARTYGAPGFAVDPEDPLHVFATAVDLRSQRCGLLRSADSGQTWDALDASPSLDAYPLCLMTNSHTTQGKIAFEGDQTLYYALNGWDDTTSFDEVTRGQDIYIAAVQYDPVTPATSNLVKYLLAGVIGLVVVGLAFLALSLFARRRTALSSTSARPAGQADASRRPPCRPGRVTLVP